MIANNRYIKSMTIYNDKFEEIQVTNSDIRYMFGPGYETDDSEQFFNDAIKFVSQYRQFSVGDDPYHSDPRYAFHYEIQFFDKNTGEMFVNNHSLFVMGNEVWGNNDCYFESQSSTIGFEDCIKPFPHLGWRVIQND